MYLLCTFKWQRDTLAGGQVHLQHSQVKTRARSCFAKSSAGVYIAPLPRGCPQLRSAPCREAEDSLLCTELPEGL